MGKLMRGIILYFIIFIGIPLSILNLLFFFDVYECPFLQIWLIFFGIYSIVAFFFLIYLIVIEISETRD